MKCVNIYCYLSSLDEEEQNDREYLADFLSDITDYLKVWGHTFGVVWAYSDLAPEPNVLLPEWSDEGVLILHFQFEHYRLEHTLRIVELLKLTMQSLVWQKGISVDFEYHLDEE